jgi:hypothetical protein
MATIKRKITPVAKGKPAPTAKAKATPKPETPKANTVAKPSIPMHDLHSDWSGPSDVANSRVSRTPIDPSKFGTLLNAKLTERDQKALATLREQFGFKGFQRANVDAGILRRLGERGFIEHVSGSDNSADAVFKLTKRAA